MASFLVARSGEVHARPLGVPGPGAVKTNGYDGRGLLCSPPSPPHPETDPVQPDGRGARRRPHGSGCQTASVTEQPRNNDEHTDPETAGAPRSAHPPDGRPVLGTARAAWECRCRSRRPRDLPQFVPLPAPWLRSGRSGPGAGRGTARQLAGMPWRTAGHSILEMATDARRSADECDGEA